MHPFVCYEKKQHGTREFPAEYYYVDSHHPRYVMSAHLHTEWELIRIKSGSFTIFVDKTEINANAGDVLLLRESMLHSGIPDNCIYECFVFDYDKKMFLNVSKIYGLFSFEKTELRDGKLVIYATDENDLEKQIVVSKQDMIIGITGHGKTDF